MMAEVLLRAEAELRSSNHLGFPHGGVLVSTWDDKLALRVEGQILVVNWNILIANDYEGYALAA